MVVKKNITQLYIILLYLLIYLYTYSFLYLNAIPEFKAYGEYCKLGGDLNCCCVFNFLVSINALPQKDNFGLELFKLGLFKLEETIVLFCLYKFAGAGYGGNL